MLSHLQIENIAIIEKAQTEFRAGLNILTGETGAGKSILIDAINAVSGAKTSRELLRSGEAQAGVTAAFQDIDDRARAILTEIGAPVEEDGSLVLSRRMYKDGRNACFINGMSVTVSMLRKLAMSLINIHGQRDSQTLLDPDSHIDVLDGFCCAEKDRAAFTDAYRRLKATEKEIRDLTLDEAYKARRVDLLTYQINELEAAGIEPGMLERLRHRRNVLRNAEKVRDALREALFALLGGGEEPGAEALLREAERRVVSVTDIAKMLSVVTERLEEARDTVSQASSMLDDALSQLDTDGNETEEIEEKLDLLYRLGKKYGPTEEEMLSFLADAKAELAAITGAQETLERLEMQRQACFEETVQLAAVLSEKRQAGGERLAGAIREELKFLDMPNVAFICEITPAELWEKGTEAVQFLISANPGETPRPLGKVASGGELSRIMLAIKTVLNAKDGAATLIFDEIDQGVSGAAAGRIAEKLSSLSRRTQVLCITHSAQIAAFADEHKYLSKSVKNGKTYTEIRALNDEERTLELARINYGSSPSETQIESARQMIRRADAQKSGG